jgi:hypothetical protein
MVSVDSTGAGITNASTATPAPAPGTLKVAALHGADGVVHGAIADFVRSSRIDHTHVSCAHGQLSVENAMAKKTKRTKRKAQSKKSKAPTLTVPKGTKPAASTAPSATKKL